jgi:signal transduction histidine kinase
MTDDQTFARLVAVACHDLRNPLATVYGFARTLTRVEMDERSARYIEMIDAASRELGQLLDELALVARIESGRFEPDLVETDSLELARAAATMLSEERLAVSGDGAPILVPVEQTTHALARLARAAARHGGHDEVALVIRGTDMELSPISRSAAPVVLGEEFRELGAAAAVALIEALGGSLRVDGERLLIALRAPEQR